MFKGEVFMWNIDFVILLESLLAVCPSCVDWLRFGSRIKDDPGNRDKR